MYVFCKTTMQHIFYGSCIPSALCCQGQVQGQTYEPFTIAL